MDPEGLKELFTDTSYKEIVFEHKDFKQKIFALKTAATDFDMTGQVIWQAANIMSVWLVEDSLPNFKGKRVVELGAGPGLCGLIAAREAKLVALTDNEDIVMDLIDRNLLCADNPDCKMIAAQLDWEKMDQPGFFETLDYTNAEQQVEGKFTELQFDIAIGSDVIYWPVSIIPLCNTLQKLFENNPDIIVYICYIERAKQTHRQLKQRWTEYGFNFAEFAQDITKPIATDSFLYRLEKK